MHYNPKTTAQVALKQIKSGNRVFIQGGAAVPLALTEALLARANELQNVELVCLHLEGASELFKAEYKDVFKLNALFLGSNVREAVQAGRGDYIPVFLSEVPLLFRKGILPLDVALVQISPPDHHGYCSLGVSVDVTLAAVESARYVIAQINPQMPRTFGDGVLHISRFNAIVEAEHALPEHKIAPPNEIEKAIGSHVATLVDNGATLQMGIGAIPNAVLTALKNHKDLGVHTEMFSDGIMDLVNLGIITGIYKRRFKRKITSGFAVGTKKLYEFMHDNPSIAMLDISYVNDSNIIRQHPKVTAINSAIEVDLTGQVCADSIGTKLFSGVGGQMDFIRGASLSEDGKPIIALPSVTSKGESRIVPILKPGAGVVTTRAHVHYVVTEYGIAYLYGKNIRQRIKALINIAHPDHKDSLSQAAEHYYHLYNN